MKSLIFQNVQRRSLCGLVSLRFYSVSSSWVFLDTFSGETPSCRAIIESPERKLANAGHSAASAPEQWSSLEMSVR